MDNCRGREMSHGCLPVLFCRRQRFSNGIEMWRRRHLEYKRMWPSWNWTSLLIQNRSLCVMVLWRGARTSDAIMRTRKKHLFFEVRQQICDNQWERWRAWAFKMLTSGVPWGLPVLFYQCQKFFNDFKCGEGLSDTIMFMYDFDFTLLSWAKTA